MLENSLPLAQRAPLYLASERVDPMLTLQGESTPFDPRGRVGLNGIQKSKDALQNKEDLCFNGFESWPNQTQEKVTEADFRTSLSSVITALRTGTNSEMNSTKKPLSVPSYFQNRSMSLPVRSAEGLLFALQEFLIGRGIAMHLSSEKTIESMHVSEEKMSERRIVEYEKQNQLAEEASQKSRLSGILMDVAFASVGFIAGMCLFPAGTLLLAASATFLLAAGVVGFIKAGFEYAQMNAIAANSAPEGIRAYGKTIKILDRVENWLMIASFAVDGVVFAGMFLPRLGRILGIGKLVQKIVGPSRVILELKPIGQKAGEGLRVSAQALQESAVISKDIARATCAQEFSTAKFSARKVTAGQWSESFVSGWESFTSDFSTSLRTALEEIGLKVNAEEIEAIIEAAHRETRHMQSIDSAKQALEYSELFSKNLASLLHKEWAAKALKAKLNFATGYFGICRIVTTIIAAISGEILQIYATNSRTIANKMSAVLQVERDVHQPLLQKAITKKIEDLGKNAESMAKSLKYISDWVTQLMQTQKSAIRALRPI